MLYEDKPESAIHWKYVSRWSCVFLTWSFEVLGVDGGGCGFKGSSAQDIVCAESQRVHPVGVTLQRPALDTLHPQTHTRWGGCSFTQRCRLILSVEINTYVFGSPDFDRSVLGGRVEKAVTTPLHTGDGLSVSSQDLLTASQHSVPNTDGAVLRATG